MLPQPGQVIENRYEIVREIGDGGMGIVYEIRGVTLHNRLAMKLLRPDLARHELIKERFWREARLQSTIEHHNIARVIDLIACDGVPAIIMEYLEGQSLADWLWAGNQLDPEGVRYFGFQVASALLAAHKHGVVHRDLKPDNIFVVRGPDGKPVPKLLDFGVAKVLEGTKLTVTDAFVGTYRYASPEQVADPETIDSRSDLYSLGVILWQLLMHRYPYDGVSGSYALQDAVLKLELDPLPDSVPPGLKALVEGLLQKDRERRVQSAADITEALRPTAAPNDPTVVNTEPGQRSVDYSLEMTHVSPQQRPDHLRGVVADGGEAELMPSQDYPVAEPVDSVEILPGDHDATHMATEPNPAPTPTPTTDPTPIAIELLDRTDSDTGEDPNHAATADFPILDDEFPAGPGTGKRSRPILQTGSSPILDPSRVKTPESKRAGQITQDFRFVSSSYGVIRNSRRIRMLAVVLGSALLGAVATYPFWGKAVFSGDGNADPSILTLEPLPEYVDVDAAAGMVSLVDSPNVFDNVARATAYNGGRLRVVAEMCADDDGRWAQVELMSDADARANLDSVGVIGWVRIQDVAPHRYGCCDGRSFDCTPVTEDDVAEFFELSHRVSETTPRSGAVVRSSPIERFDVDNYIADLEENMHIEITRELCSIDGFRWAEVSVYDAPVEDEGSGGQEAPPLHTGWVFRPSLSPNPDGCCLGRAPFDPGCTE